MGDKQVSKFVLQLIQFMWSLEMNVDSAIQHADCASCSCLLLCFAVGVYWILDSFQKVKFVTELAM